MKFRLLGPFYVALDGRKYKKGDVVISAEDLSKKFANAFELIEKDVEVEQFYKAPDIPEPSICEHSSCKPMADVGGDAAILPSPPTEIEGQDVTNLFSVAESVDMKVFLADGKYTVVDGTDGKIMKKGIVGTQKVKKFLKQYAA